MNAVPSGYLENADGSLVPIAKIKPVDLDRDALVTDLCRAAENTQATLLAFKLNAVKKLDCFIERSLSKYNVKPGRNKGNVILTSFDGRYRVVRQNRDTMTFDQNIIAAQALIDGCVTGWSEGRNQNLRMLIQAAFRVDGQGKISTSRILGLRRIKIEDPKWIKAMDAIGESLKANKTKTYMRYYRRDDDTGKYMPISLDVSSL